MIQNWLQLVGLISTSVVGMPRLLLGFTFYTNTTWYNATLGIACAAVLSYLTALVMLDALGDERMVTPLLYQRYFGSSGKIVIAALLTAGGLVWMTIHSTFLVTFISDTFQLTSALWPTVIFSTVIFIGLTLGIKKPRLLSHSGTLNVLLLIILLIAMMYSVKPSPATISVSDKTMSFFDVFATMYGLSLFSVFNIPSVFRNAATINDAKRALLVLNAVVIPLLSLIGWIAGFFFQEPTLQDCCSHHGPLIVITSSAFFIVAGISALGGSSFSASAALSSLTIFHKPINQFYMIAGAVFVLYITGIAHNILPAIGLAGVGIVSLGGVVIINQLRRNYGIESLSIHENFIGMIVGLLVGILSFSGYALTANASVDALLATCLTLVILTIRDSLQNIYLNQ